MKLVIVLLSIFSAGVFCGTQIQLQDVNGERPRKVVSVSKNSPLCDEKERLVDVGDSVLEEDLLQAKSKISMLESQRIRLARQIEQMNLPIAENTTVPELLSRVDRLPADLISRQLTNILNEEYVEDIEDIHEFAKQLIEVALSEGEFLTSTELETGQRVNLTFSQSPVGGLREFVDLDTVDQYERIFVHFTTPSTFSNLIVRWQHTESGEILNFSPLKLLGNQGSYISLKPQSGWNTGSYQVSVYDLTEEQRLVGTGRYQVSGVSYSERQLHEPDYEVIEDLLSSGRAAMKSY